MRRDGGPAAQFLHRYTLLFWDFDGVIKESVEVKTQAYLGLFAHCDAAVVARIREHHEAHGGMSRFEKIPLYLGWAGESAGTDEVARRCALFASAVRQRVIDSAWVPGAREYLHAHHARQRCVVLTATPQTEIEDILRTLEISNWFCEVHGTPTAKAAAIPAVLARWNCPATDALVIGDSTSDYEAARSANVDFLLRRTGLNTQLQHQHDGPQCENFLNG
jgi:phosphoglycolate phosphatase-like HAD superfamily hydrolase